MNNCKIDPAPLKAYSIQNHSRQIKHMDYMLADFIAKVHTFGLVFEANHLGSHIDIPDGNTLIISIHVSCSTPAKVVKNLRLALAKTCGNN